jgi:hypothetical protein
METNVQKLKEKVKKDLEKERKKHRAAQQNMKVSFPTHIQMCTIQHSFIPVLFSFPQTL